MNLPTESQHLVILGATGSGKTQAALWHLSLRDYITRPWLIINFKRDELVDGIPNAVHIDMDEVPVQPGIYITHPMPDDQEPIGAILQEIWTRGRTGVYVDEGLMMGNRNRSFRALLTQGRSKQIPLIVNSQRPAWMDPFVFTEASFVQVFRLQHRDDIKRVEQFVPGELSKRLPEFNSYYYDVKNDVLSQVQPVPSIDEIYSRFRRHLKPPKTVL